MVPLSGHTLALTGGETQRHGAAIGVVFDREEVLWVVDGVKRYIRNE